jgi:pyrimidine-nucleoside phosphorylase
MDEFRDFRKIIARRRDGIKHSPAELKHIAEAAVDPQTPDYQLAAWLMAAYIHPLDLEETAQLTIAMARSGTTLDLSSLPLPHVDKHSTGGVGDKTTLVLLPLLAACGLNIVKMSGAGLGITGGTIDKLKSIPGFDVGLPPDRLLEQSRKIGLALSGQTADLAPADRRLYELRDATSTTSSIPLIVSSILCKKLAGGADVVLIDVKCGSGAFMTTQADARELASALEEVGKRCNLLVKTTISDMTQPLGSTIGNALEIKEAVRVLSNIEGSPSTDRFKKLCISLAEETLIVSGKSPSPEMARGAVQNAFASGTGLEKFLNWIAAQGGPTTVRSLVRGLGRAPCRMAVRSDRTGWISKIDAATFGEAVIELGGGRLTKTDEIDNHVGLSLNMCVGSYIREGDLLFTVHTRNKTEGARAIVNSLAGITFSPTPIPQTPLFL